VEANQVNVMPVGWEKGVGQRHSQRGATPPRRVALARMIDEDPAHCLRSHSEEVRSSLPMNAILIDQACVGLVDERGGLERVPNPLLPEKASGQLAQLVVDEGHQGSQRPAIAPAPGDEQIGHV
jgi:hypothetical protein